MKVHILYPFKEGPWGGANQFLGGLKNFLILNKKHCESQYQADIILFNLNPSALLLLLLSKIKKIKKKYPKKILVVRIDGPVFLVRGKGLAIDRAFFNFTKNLADGVVYQSHWSKKNCFNLGMEEKEFQTTIVNAPDFAIFNRSGRKSWQADSKIRLIATSWSANWKKGFDVYQWLDQNLDFARYEMTFVGNTPITFKNIQHISPLPSQELARKFKNSDIFITASRLEACSNSLIEALHCGLPVIGPNHSSNPDIIGRAGEVFNHAQELPELIKKIAQSYEEYQARINLPSMEGVGKAYYDFMYSIYETVQRGEYVPKRLTWTGYFRVMWSLWLWKGHERLTGMLNRFGGKKR